MCRIRSDILKAIQGNDFLRNLEKVQINEIVDCMYERSFTKDQYICREGGVGTQFYVISGKVSNNGIHCVCSYICGGRGGVERKKFVRIHRLQLERTCVCIHTLCSSILYY